MKIPALQYLRAIAAIAVVIAHASGMAAFEKYFNEKVIFYDFFHYGHLGVPLFFIISGFIIVISSHSATTLLPKKTFLQFILARFIRIIPVMWIAIISYALLRYLATGQFDYMPYINALFLLPIGDVDPNNIWTLRHEFIFYITFGLIFLFFKQKIFRLIFMLWVIVPFIMWYHSFPFGQYEDLSNFGQFINVIFYYVNFLFFIGVILGFRYLKDNLKYDTHTKNVLVNKLWFSILLFSIMQLVVMFLDRTYDLSDFQIALIVSPVFAFMVYVSTYNILNPNKLFLYLGNASYSIYLFHPHIESGMLFILKKLTPNMQVEIIVVLISLMSIIIGGLIYSYIETPLIKYLSKRFKNEK